MKEARRLIKRESHVFYSLLCNKAAGISVENGFIPILLPILAISFIHTYTTHSIKMTTAHLDRADSIHRAGIDVALKRVENKGEDGENFNARPAKNMLLMRLENTLDAEDKVRPKLSVRPEPRHIVPDITRGDPMKKELSITFDGGSEATDAKDILEILREKNIRTTIFLTGEFIKRYPELVKKMVEDGHEIGNHTLTHPHLTTFEKNFRQLTLHGIDKEFITGQLKETARLFKEVTGKDMIPYWRAPYGEQNAAIRQWAYEAGFTHIGWTKDYKTKETLDSLDWVSNEESEFYHSADEIKNRILSFDKDGNEVMGGIILMHLGTERKDSRASAKLPEIIDSLEDRGYRFVKVSELLEHSR